MVDELKITNEVWRYWDEHKIKPPFEWYQLRMRVEEAVREGKKPEEIIQAFITHYSNSDKLKDLFAGRTLEGYVEAAKVRTLETFRGVTFYFETETERDRAQQLLLQRHNISLTKGSNNSLTDIGDPDYILELLASEGFDTSKVLVERA